jgi:hypothetical protein
VSFVLFVVRDFSQSLQPAWPLKVFRDKNVEVRPAEITRRSVGQHCSSVVAQAFRDHGSEEIV